MHMHRPSLRTPVAAHASRHRCSTGRGRQGSQAEPDLVGVDAIIDGTLQIVQQLVGGGSQHHRGHRPGGRILLQADDERAADLLARQALGKAQLLGRWRAQADQCSGTGCSAAGMVCSVSPHTIR